MSICKFASNLKHEMIAIWQRFHRNFEFSGTSNYRSVTVNSKSFVGKVLLRIKWKFKLN